nr:MAG TPA: hypothetical protein [Caudoviricetes sp.]
MRSIRIPCYTICSYILYNLWSIGSFNDRYIYICNLFVTWNR